MISQSQRPRAVSDAIVMAKGAAVTIRQWFKEQKDVPPELVPVKSSAWAMEAALDMIVSLQVPQLCQIVSHEQSQFDYPTVSETLVYAQRVLRDLHSLLIAFDQKRSDLPSRARTIHSRLIDHPYSDLLAQWLKKCRTKHPLSTDL